MKGRDVAHRGPQLENRQPENPGDEKGFSLRDIPSWINAVGVLIAALVALAAFLAGRVTEQHSTAHSPPQVTRSTPPGTHSSPVAPPAAGQPTPQDPAPKPGTAVPPGTQVGSAPRLGLLSDNHIEFALGGSIQQSIGDGDLKYFNPSGKDFRTDGGGLAVISTPPSYHNCKAANPGLLSVASVAQGATICFQGHGVIAAATVAGYRTDGGRSYVTLNVTVWQD